MMMMGLHFMGDVPFREVFIHTRVLDEKGQKMSKTKGNVVDPLTSSTNMAPTRSASRWRSRQGKARVSGLVLRAWKPAAISAPSCGTRPASAK